MGWIQTPCVGFLFRRVTTNNYLRRNHTTLTKYYLLSSITIRRRHRQIGHGDINKIILQLLGDLLTPHLQRLPTKSSLRHTSSSRCPLIFVTNNQKKQLPCHDLVVCKITTTKTIIQLGTRNGTRYIRYKSHRIPTDNP